MRKKLKIVAWSLFTISYGFNLLAWGGLGINREFAPHVLDSILTQAPIALIYVYPGRSLVRGLSMQEMAEHQAERWFGAAYPQMRENPLASVETLFTQWSSTAKLSYYGCLLMLLVGLYLSATTPQPLRTFGGRR